MRKRSFHAVLFSLSLLLIITSFAECLAQKGVRARRQSTVLFETVGYGNKQIILPIVIMQGGRYVAPPAFGMKAARDEHGDNSVRHDFLAGLDLDGDGVSEAIVSVNDYRSRDDWNYVIYKKQGRRWRSIYRGGRLPLPRGAWRALKAI